MPSYLADDIYIAETHCDSVISLPRANETHHVDKSRTVHFLCETCASVKNPSRTHERKFVNTYYHTVCKIDGDFQHTNVGFVFSMAQLHRSPSLTR